MNAVEARLPLLLALAFFSLGREVRAGDWITLQDCDYVPNPANDGDSFHVRARNKEYIFRLYFVDAPETDTSIRERVREQAKYFHVTLPQTLKIGSEAERFSRQKLVPPFTVHTCLQDARGRSHLPRYFAFVQVGNTDLGESLVANGLARVFGAASEAPGMNRPEVEWRKLKELERSAKERRVGGWGISVGRLNARAATQPATGSDYFEAFFDPKVATGSINHSPPPGQDPKLDVNTATTEALQALPGIGQVLAQRIMAARPFGSADELMKVNGIKNKKYEQLRPYFE